MTGFARGVLINFLYAAQHELSHATVFKMRVINEWFGRAIGFIEIFPRDYDQIMHFAHHQYTQNWERDGELVREPYTLTSYLLWLFGVSYWRNRVFGIVRRSRNAAGDCIFLCELGPPEYAMTGPDGREMSNRWDEALLIKTWVRQIWDELGGDD